MNATLIFFFVFFSLGTIVIASSRMITFAKFMAAGLLLCVVLLILGGSLSFNMAHMIKIVIPACIGGAMAFFDIHSIYSFRPSADQEKPVTDDIPEYYE